MKKEATGMKKMKFRRLQLGFSQYELERLTNIHQARLSLFERGYREPSTDEKKKLAKALKIEEEELFKKSAEI